MSTPVAIREAAMASYFATGSLQVAAETHGVPRTSLRRWLAEAGTRVPRRHAYSPPIYEGGWVRQGLVLRPATPHRETNRRQEQHA